MVSRSREDAQGESRAGRRPAPDSDQRMGERQVAPADPLPQPDRRKRVFLSHDQPQSQLPRTGADRARMGHRRNRAGVPRPDRDCPQEHTAAQPYHGPHALHRLHQGSQRTDAPPRRGIQSQLHRPHGFGKDIRLPVYRIFRPQRQLRGEGGQLHRISREAGAREALPLPGPPRLR